MCKEFEIGQILHWEPMIPQKLYGESYLYPTKHKRNPDKIYDLVVNFEAWKNIHTRFPRNMMIWRLPNLAKLSRLKSFECLHGFKKYFKELYSW